MDKSKEKKILADYKKIVTPTKQTLFVDTEWKIQNGLFAKFSLYPDSCGTISTLSIAKNPSL